MKVVNKNVCQKLKGVFRIDAYVFSRRITQWLLYRRNYKIYKKVTNGYESQYVYSFSDYSCSICQDCKGCKYAFDPFNYDDECLMDH